MSIAVHYMQLHVPLRDVNNFLIFPKMAEIEDNTLLREIRISLRMLKNTSRVNAHEKKNFVYPAGYIMFYFLYKHQWNTKPFHPLKLFSLRKAGFIV